MRRNWWILAFVATSLCLGGAMAAQAQDKASLPGGGAKAPDFILRDIEGKSFRLSDQRGKAVLLLFTTTWCGYCREEIPHFKKIHETYSRSGLVVVNIDIQEPKEKVARYARQYQLPYRVLLDANGDVSGVYEVLGVPSLVLVNREGMIVCRHCRSIDATLEGMFRKK